MADNNAIFDGHSFADLWAMLAHARQELKGWQEALITDKHPDDQKLAEKYIFATRQACNAIEEELDRRWRDHPLYAYTMKYAEEVFDRREGCQDGA